MGQWTYSIPRPPVSPGCTWAYKILPYIEQDNLYNNYSFTVPVKVFMDPLRGGTGLATDLWDGKPDSTIYVAGQVTDYAANALVIGSGINTEGPLDAPTYYDEWTKQPSGWNTFRRTLSGITDGTSNTILLGIKAMATQVYNDRGAGKFTMSNGTTRDKLDDPITRAGPDTFGVVRSLGPDTTWYMAGDPGGPTSYYDKDIPGSKYRIHPTWDWLQYTYAVVKDAPDLDAWNRWGSPYAGGGLFGMADGSVRSLSFSTSYKVIIPLSTPAGGEVVDAN
jgi:hypothetical protein